MPICPKINDHDLRHFGSMLVWSGVRTIGCVVDKLLAYGTIGAGVAFAVLFVELARRRKIDPLTGVLFLVLATFVILVGAYLEYTKQVFQAARLECQNEFSSGTGSHPFANRDMAAYSKRIAGGYELVAFRCEATGMSATGDSPSIRSNSDTVCEFTHPPGTTATLVLTYCKVKFP